MILLWASSQGCAESPLQQPTRELALLHHSSQTCSVCSFDYRHSRAAFGLYGGLWVCGCLAAELVLLSWKMCKYGEACFTAERQVRVELDDIQYAYLALLLTDHEWLLLCSIWLSPITSPQCKMQRAVVDWLYCDIKGPVTTCGLLYSVSMDWTFQ